MDRKKVLGIVIALAVLAIFLIMPEPEGLSAEGKASLGLLIAGIIMWVSEALPLAITTFLLMIAMPYLGIMEINQVWKEFISPVFFFVLATFGLTAALLSTNIPVRIAANLMKWAGSNSKKLVLGFAAGTAILSGIMSNVPTCALFMSLALTVLKANGDPEPGTTNLGKCLMIVIPWSAVLGGFLTPAGTSINILALYMLKDYTGIWIRFLDWMIVGIPTVAIGILIAAWACNTIYKPEEISAEAQETSDKLLKEIGPLSVSEKKVLVIVALMFTFWIASTWVTAIDATIVAVAGMIAFFIPGIEVIKWKDFVDNTSWEALFMIGGIQSIAAGILTTGAASWLVNTTMAGAAEWPTLVTILVASTIASILHVIVPTGPAIVGLALIPFVDVATMAGISIPVLALICAFWSGVVFLFPIDTVPLITFGQGYYKMFDMVKSGLIPMIAMIIVTTLLIPPLVGLLGY